MRRALCAALAALLASSSWAGVGLDTETATAILGEVKDCREFRARALERFDLYEQAEAAMQEQAALDAQKIGGLTADKEALKASLTTYRVAVTDLEDSGNRLKEELKSYAARLEECERSKPSRLTWAAIGGAVALLLVVGGGALK